MIAKHRESWQQIGALLTSKAALSSFAQELSKKMGMRYQSPPMPVDLNVRTKAGGTLLGWVRHSADRIRRGMDEPLAHPDAREHLEAALEQLGELECLLEERDAVYEEWVEPNAENVSN